MPSTRSARSCVQGALPATPPRRRGEDSGGDGRGVGWGGRDRTYECRNQNPVPYHLATPQGNTDVGMFRVRQNSKADDVPALERRMQRLPRAKMRAHDTPAA